MSMGGTGSGTLKIQRPMADFYRKHFVSPGAIVKYQYGVKDSLIMSRVDLRLEDIAAIERALPRLDMLVIEKEAVWIIELKPRAELRDVGQALHYVESLKRDTMLAKYLDRPVRWAVVTLSENANVRALVEGQGGKYVVISPLELPRMAE